MLEYGSHWWHETSSQCSIIKMQQKHIGWHVLALHWMHSYPKKENAIHGKSGSSFDIWLWGGAGCWWSLGARVDRGAASLHLMFAQCWVLLHDCHFVYRNTGLMPLRVWHVQLAISYLRYLLQLPCHHYTYAALQETKDLLRGGCPSWIGDLNWAIEHLPSLTIWNVHTEDMDCRQLEDLKRTLWETCDDILQNVIETSSKCVLLWGCLEMDEDGKCKQIIWKLCHYLMIIHVPAHRKAFTSLMLLNHPLAVERLRWREWYWETVPHLWCLCHFCCMEVEDEPHVLLVCDTNMALVDLWQAFKWDVQVLVPVLQWKADCFQQLPDLLHDPHITGCLAKYISNVFDIFNSEPMFVAPPYIYLPAV